VKKITGDLIKLFKEGEFDVIVHGCNCGNNMGDGIAKTIRDEFPEAYAADLETQAWDISKLGTISCAGIENGRTVINAYTQYRWYGVGLSGGPLCEYDALRSCFKDIKKRFGEKSLRFGIPAIGAARAGGDWSIISAIIDEEMEGEDVTFVEYDGFDPRGNYKKWMRK
jgi:O-acetyl-ADP-ribose deacetylase (regulator of RNase III)